MELDSYRDRAERFLAELNAAYREHYAGLREDLPLDAVYDAHAELFEPGAIAALEDEPELRRFAVEGRLGLATRDADAELARREATLRIDVDGQALGFREAAVVQAGERDAERRAAIEAARLRTTREELVPLARHALEAAHACSRELGWPDHRAMWDELGGLDLGALGREAEAFLAASDAAYTEIVDRELRRTVGRGLGDWRRSDLPFFFRAPEFDELFPPDRLVESFTRTAVGMGLALDRIRLDVEARLLKSPRAFCAPVRVPEEVHLVVPPIGGADDYAALFHEGGHALHFAGVSPAAPFERRCLGDNSLTEAFAFLFDHLVEEPAWLRRFLGVRDPEPFAAHARAKRLVQLRRYCAKLLYELELHSAPELDGLDEVYAARLSGALRVAWPAATWLTDLDPGFYAARYLRAWALETRLRARLREASGEAWWEEPGAGRFLAALWREGQPAEADRVPLSSLAADLRL